MTVTKIWDDSLSNDERTVPDVSISTAKPSKNPLGYTITYHGNGLTFEDGSMENEIVVNSSGKILSGQYMELTGSSGWYSDSRCTTKIELDSDGLPVNGITSDLTLYAKAKTFVLKQGTSFYYLIPTTAIFVEFTDEVMPASATPIKVDADGDNGVVAWMDGTTMKVSTQTKGLKVQANPDSNDMFYGKTKLKNIDLTLLDTQNVTDMGSMFRSCSSLTTLDLTPLNTRNVTNMSSMFFGCSGLTNLDLTPLNTHKVSNMSDMFCNCNKLTTLDLTPLSTSNVTNMNGMFENCRGLTSLDLTPLDTRNVTDMNSMFSGCSGLSSLDLSPLNTSKVTNMSNMFRNCSGLTDLDLTPLDMQNVTNISYIFFQCDKLTALNLSSLDTRGVTNMSYMFYGCSKLINLSLGDKFTFVGSDYDLPKGTWYASDGTAYTSDGTTCTIPNNKSDTYTRR